MGNNYLQTDYFQSTVCSTDSTETNQVKFTVMFVNWSVFMCNKELTLWLGRRRSLEGWQDHRRTESCDEFHQGVTLQSGQCQSPSNTGSCWSSPLPHLPASQVLHHTRWHVYVCVLLTAYSFIFALRKYVTCLNSFYTFNGFHDASADSRRCRHYVFR